MLGATLQHHFNQQSLAYEQTIESLGEKTYVDNLKTGSGVRELSRFKEEATEILESAKCPVHKWESDVQELDEEPNPSKILGLMWDKREDRLEIQFSNEAIYSESAERYYDPLGVISPTIVEGKRIYREACDQKTGWNRK